MNPSSTPSSTDGPPDRHRDPVGRDERQPQLQQPTDGDLLEDVLQSGQRELEPDGEQQQHHSELRQDLDGLDAVHGTQRMGPEHRTRQQQARDRRQPQAGQHNSEHRRDRGDDRELVQQRDLYTGQYHHAQEPNRPPRRRPTSEKPLAQELD